MHAFTPDGTPLGTVHATAWVREEGTVCASLSRAERAAIPIEEKESYRWVDDISSAREEAERCPTTQFISVADSEADIYELLVGGDDGTADVCIGSCGRVRIARCWTKTAKRLGKSISAIRLWNSPSCSKRRFTSAGAKPKVGCETRGRRQPRESRKPRSRCVRRPRDAASAMATGSETAAGQR